MNPALFTLIRLQSRGFTRRMLRGARSPRRAIFLVLGLAVIVLWLGPIVLTAATIRHSHPERMAFSLQRFRAVAPLALLGICVLTIVSSAGDKAIAFTPGEVDLLFPGPFSRRELLGYKLLKSMLAAFLTALPASIALMPYAESWAACYGGVFLTLLFIQLFSTAGVLVGQTVSQRAYTTGRRVILIAAIGLVLVLVRQLIAGRGAMEALYAFRYSDFGRGGLAPFSPFSDAITAASAGEFAEAASKGAVIDLALLAVVVLLDANYVEAALAASRRRYALIRRIRGGSLLTGHLKGSSTWHLPRPPFARGAGPVAWRQATSAVRSAKGLLLLLLILAVGIGPLFASALHGTDVAGPVVGAMAWLTILLSGMLKFDFRGDLDHIEELKTLPINPMALAVGQLVVPTLILTAAHVLLLASAATVVRSQRDVLIATAFLALPFNAMLMAAENLIFLLFPTRPAAASPGDFQVLGRQVAQLIMKGLAVLSGCVAAVAVALPMYVYTGGSLVVLVMIAGAALVGETVALVPAIAWAYNRFDPSVDTPA